MRGGPGSAWGRGVWHAACLPGKPGACRKRPLRRADRAKPLEAGPIGVVPNPRHAGAEGSDRVSLFKLRMRDQSEAKPKQNARPGRPQRPREPSALPPEHGEAGGTEGGPPNRSGAAADRPRETEGPVPTVAARPRGADRSSPLGGGPTVAAPRIWDRENPGRRARGTADRAQRKGGYQEISCPSEPHRGRTGPGSSGKSCPVSSRSRAGSRSQASTGSHPTN